MSTISVLWKRQLIRYVRSKPRIIGSLGQPLLFLVALGFGLGPVFEKAGQGSYLQFLTPGVVAMTVLFAAMFSGIELIWDRQFGFLKETLVAPVSRFSIMLGRTLGGATTATAQGLIVLVLATLFGYTFNPLGLLVALPVLFLTALLFTSLGTAIATRMTDMQAFPIIMNFIIMPLFFLSGALFPLSVAPHAIQDIAAVNPLTYGVDALRLSFAGSFPPIILLDVAILLVVTLLFLALGSRLFSGIQV